VIRIIRDHNTLNGLRFAVIEFLALSSAVVGATLLVAESRFGLFALVGGVLAGLAVSMPVYAFGLVLHPAGGSIEGGPPSPNCGSQHQIVVRVREVRLVLCPGI
jgi:hypothetical protein